MVNTRIAVLGSGSWGTALAVHLSRQGSNVVLWGHESAEIAEMEQERINERYLPGINFPESLQLTSQLESAVQDIKVLIVAVPSRVFREFIGRLESSITADTQIAWATKGLEEQTGLPLHNVVNELLPQCRHAGVISGPTFALEVAKGLPTAVTVASDSDLLKKNIASCLHGGNFRVYTSSDVVGVEIGGALKNVLAIATGIADGLGFGANTRAALITRGLHEIMSLGEVLGGQRETFMGLAGVGDLVLTCTDDQSRNRRLGLALASGKTINDALKEIGQEVEGLHTAKQAMLLSEKTSVELPIIEQVYRILHEGLAARDAVSALLTRKARAE